MTSKLLKKFSDIKVKIYSRDEDKHREMKYHFNDDRLSFMLGDIRDYERMEECMKNVNVVLHAGALKQLPSLEFNAMEAIKTNTMATYNVMRASDKQNVEQVIAISTDKACKPISSYGMTKALMEKIIVGDDITSDTKFGCVRYGNVLGSRGSVMPVWSKIISENKPIPITSFEMKRFFLTLDQATELVLFASKSLVGGEIYVSQVPSLLIKDLAQVYAELQTGNADYPMVEIGIRAGEKIDEELISEEEMTHTEKLNGYYKINRPDVYTHVLPKENYSSSTNAQMTRTEIKRLIENLEWVK